MRPGEQVATDGVVVRGTSALDASMLTGEACRSRSSPGDEVTGATVNAGGRLVVRATRVGADTRLAQMARLVDAAQNGKADVQRLADRVSAVFVPVVIAMAAGTLGFWLGAGAGPEVGLHGRRGRADRGLPVCARARDADGPDGRHGPGRPARHPDPRPRGARGHPPRRHRRSSTRPAPSRPADGAGRRGRGARAGRATTYAASPRPSSPPRSTRSPGRSSRRTRASYPPVDRLRGRWPGSGCAGTVEGRRVEVGRPGAEPCAPGWRAAVEAAEAAGPDRRRASTVDGEAGRCRWWSPTR